MEQVSLKYQTKKGLYWKFFEQFATYGMQFVVSIIMARLLSPSDFGTAALPAVFLSIAQVFIDGSFGLALIRKENVTEEDLSTSFYYSIVVGIVLYIALYFTAPIIANFYDKEILTSLIRVSALVFLWNPLLTPQSVILNRKLDFKTPARIAVINKIVSAILGIVAAYLGYGIWSLIISTLSSSIFTVVQTWWAVKWIPKTKFSKVSFKYLWSYGNKMMSANFLNTAYANILPIMIGKSLGTIDLGVYNRAKGFAALPSQNLGGILNTVSFPVLSKIQDNEEKLAIYYRKMIKVSSYIVFPIMLIMSAVAYPLVITLVTEKWSSCVILLQILCFSYMFQPVQMLNLNLLEVKGRTELALKLEIIKKVICGVVLIWATQFSLETICVCDFCLTMFALFLNTYYTGKLIGLGYIEQMKDILPSFILSVITMFLLLGINHFIDNYYMQLFIGGCLGPIFYLTISRILRFEELEYVKYMLSKHK